MHLAVARWRCTTDSNPCAIFLLGFTIDSSRSARESLRTDAGELGADFAAGRFAAEATDLVTANALDLGPRGEEPPPALAIAAGEHLAKAATADRRAVWSLSYFLILSRNSGSDRLAAASIRSS